jgi:hypothetical protein
VNPYEAFGFLEHWAWRGDQLPTEALAEYARLLALWREQNEGRRVK